jgi:1-deoxy-D-xylulose-5-phosphate reductoisomerase
VTNVEVDPPLGVVPGQARSSGPHRDGAIRSLAVIGSTGSIGRQALDVVRASPGRFEVVALAAGTSVKDLAEQVEEFRPRIVAIADASRGGELRDLCPPGVEVLAGLETLGTLAGEAGAEVVLNAVVGFAGLPVTLAALSSGKRLALANKESLIAGGPIVQAVRGTPGAELVPVDSEHSAIHQCIGQRARASIDASVRSPVRHPACGDEVSRVVVTASGGPFRGKGHSELAAVTVDEALAHPTWRMGPKITIDSSTLMNKGLEVIEAHELFGIGYDRIEVVVHPQSVVHSMVEFCDGATIAQLSYPDMRLPIAYALSYPARLGPGYGSIDWRSLRSLDFEVPDTDVFRCLALAYEAGRTGGGAPAWLNAANEVAVAAFLAGRIGWLEIAAVVEETLSQHDGAALIEVEDVLEADRLARSQASVSVAKRERAA